jgi:hypothetical protein
MTTFTVATGASIQAAIDKAVSGDTIDVQAGNYVNQFLTVDKSLTLQAVGGPVVMTETTSPPNGKAMIDAGVFGTNYTIAINGFDISGVVVGDNNGAAIRYESGQLSLSNDYFHDNQEGLLGAADPNGNITIDHSEFDHNGDGSGSTHNIYVGAINSFTITNSYIHDAVVGHEIKSRAANNTITGNRIFDNSGSASYSIDLPNGGNANISNNQIEQGPNTQNPAMIAYGEEGRSNTGNTIAITSNMLVNDDGRGTFLLNPTGATIGFNNNSSYGLGASLLPSGSNNAILTTRPTLDTSHIVFGTTPPVVTPPPVITPPPVVTPPPPPPLTLNQYHAQVLADFTAYLSVHPEILAPPVNIALISVFMHEYNSTTILTTPLTGDLWTHV